MKILAAVRHPGPAEAIVPVIKLLQSQGHQVVLIGLNNNSIETRVWSHGNLGKHKFWTNRYGEFNGEVASKIYERGFIVPTHPFLNMEDIDFISGVCNET